MSGQEQLNGIVCFVADIADPPTLVTVLYESDSVLAIANLNGQLFVTLDDHNQQVLVYNTTSSQLQLLPQSININSNKLSGLATDATNNCLYVADNHNHKVYRVDLSAPYSSNIPSWPVSRTPFGLSVTSAGNVLVAMDGKTVSEYTSSGSIVNQITDSNNIFQAVEFNSSSEWVFSRYGPVDGLGVVSINGTVIQSYGSSPGSTLTQMNNPHSLAVATSGHIIVADCSNDRILVVNPSLTAARQLQLPINNLQNPNAISLDESRGRLYVGESGGGSPRLLVFDNVAHLDILFSV